MLQAQKKPPSKAVSDFLCRIGRTTRIRTADLYHVKVAL